MYLLKFFLFLFSFNALALVVYQDGKFIKSYNREQFLKIGESEKVKFLNHINNKSSTYIGISINDLIKDLKLNKSDIEEVVFECLNGYQPFLNFQLFQNRDAYLTYKSAGAKPFTRFSQKTKEIVNLGPYYLVWKLDDLHYKHRLKYSSIYKIQGINFKTKLFKLPLKDSTLSDGFSTYKRYCISCHKIKNQGGTLSSELLDSKYLRNEVQFIQYVTNPLGMNPQSEMLPFPDFQNKIYKIKHVFQLLNVLRSAKNKEKLNKKDINELNKVIKEFSTPTFGKPLEPENI
tara:strand:+ start:17490 stop:18356 length:867 start_codon:yes stop_codon:yes gene_type:complete